MISNKQVNHSHANFDNFCISSRSYGIEQLGNVQVFLCKYSLQNYDEKLYSFAGIQMPEAINKVVEKRQAEYLAGRYCAFNALGNLNIEPWDIPVGKHRQPVWPEGVVASISHTDEVALCGAGLHSNIDYLGLDVENWIDWNTAVSLQDGIVTAEEIHRFNNMNHSFGQLFTLAFSSKESLFKAIYPYVGAYFGFEAAEVVDIDLKAGCLILQLTHSLTAEFQQGHKFHCYFEDHGRFVITAIGGSLNSKETTRWN